MPGIMMGTINCCYETPCGWCSRWDKKCDRKIPEHEIRAINCSIEESYNNALPYIKNKIKEKNNGD